MKRVLLMTLTVVTLTAAAQEQRTVQERLADDTVLKEVIFQRVCNTPIDRPPLGWRRSTVQEVARLGNIPPERMTRVLEEIVRERLADLGKADDSKKWDAPIVIRTILDQMSKFGFHGSDTPALLWECAKTADGDICEATAKAYLDISEGGEDSADFLRETLGRERGLRTRLKIYEALNNTLAKLKEKDRRDDLEKLQALMLDLIRVENYAYFLDGLDKTLCATLDGYAQSLQREQAIKKPLNITTDEVRDRLTEIKAEMDKIPPDKRTDLSGRFTPTPLPMEK